MLNGELEAEEPRAVGGPTKPRSWRANPEIPGLFIEAFALANKLIELSENPIIGAKPPSGPKA